MTVTKVSSGKTVPPAFRYSGGYVKITPEQEAEILRGLLVHEDIGSIARRVGVNFATVSKRRKALRAGSIQPVQTIASRTVTPRPTIDQEQRIVALQDQLRERDKRIKDLHRAALDDDAIREILTGMARHEVQAPDWLKPSLPRSGTATPQVPVVCWSDWHIGETVQASETHGRNAYSIAIAEQRVSRLIDKTVSICRDHGPKNYPGIVVPLLGDFVSGGLHPELLATDEAEVIPSALKACDMIVTGLRRMADEFGQVYCPAVCGNHGRATPKPQFKRYIYKNFDFLIYELVRAKLAADPRIIIDHRSGNDIHFKVFGLKFAATHGDMLGVKGGDGIIGALGPIMRGAIKTGKQMSDIGLDYDILLMGHWHQTLWGRGVIVANSIKGWDEYARLSLRAPYAPPSQPLFFVHPSRGITSQWEIMVEEMVATSDAPAWVSFQPLQNHTGKH